MFRDLNLKTSPEKTHFDRDSINRKGERERERGSSVMTMDREKERELELESAMYTNCLLLGLDPSVIGLGSSNGTSRVGLFRHSNPKLGEQLLYFILSSLRGPAQSSKVRFLSTLSLFLSKPVLESLV